MKLDLDNIKPILKEVAIAQTHALRDAYYAEAEDSTEKPTEREAEILATVADIGFHGYERAVLKLVEILEGIELLKWYKDNDAYGIKYDAEAYSLAVVVPTEKRNQHDYGIGYPVLLTYNMRRGIRSDGSIGNTIGAYISDIRPATDQEIDKFFDELTTISSPTTFQHLLESFDYAKFSDTTVEANVEITVVKEEDKDHDVDNG